MNWKTKGLIQGGLSRLPFGSQCNYFLQRTAGALRSDARVDQTFLGDVPVLFERMARLDLDPASSRILEIGTGWLPILPLSLALAGFRNVVTVDLYPHLRAAAVRRTLLALEKHLDHLCFRYFGSPGQVRENYARLVAANDILSASNITYLAPCNAGATQWPAGSMDLITSNNVFEHVPTAGLLDLFAEAKRLLRPGGHVLHCVNCGDHYAYADGAISQINYLQFSGREWNRWNNSIQYQNRLRPIDFLEMADDKGLRVESAEYIPKPEYLEQLKQMEIAPDFRHYDLEQLASTSLTMIASSPRT
jgi:SAM-dependent methyltransferase